MNPALKQINVGMTRVANSATSKRLWNKAQGCRKAATLGNGIKKIHQPRRGCGRENVPQGHNLFEVENSARRVTQGSPKDGLPWALIHNLVEVEETSASNGAFNSQMVFLLERGSSTRNTQPATRHGFTLIEMLIAVALSAMVLALVSTVFFNAMRLRTGASEIAAETLPVDHAVDIMKHDLQCIVPAGVLAGPMGSDAVGIGMSAPIILEIFTGNAALNTDTPWGDVQKIDYSLQTPTNRNVVAGMSLMRGVTRNLLPSGTVAPDQQTLLDGVQNLKFTYYDGTNWNDTWTTTLSNIPIAIRVTIDFATSRSDTRVKSPVKFLVPIVTWANTNSITNQVSN